MNNKDCWTLLYENEDDDTKMKHVDQQSRGISFSL